MVSFEMQDMLPVLTELCHASEMQAELENLVEEGNYCKVGVYICSGCSLWYMCCKFPVSFSC